MTRIALMTAALAALLALASGCGGDDLSGEPEVPSGWQTVREGVVSFAVPGDWEVTREPGRDGAMSVEARGPGDEALAPVVTVLYERPPGTPVDTQLDLRRSSDERQPGAKLEEPRDVELEGAERAARWTTTYKAPAGPGRIDGVAAVREDGSSVMLRGLALDESNVDTAAIADSLRLAGD